MHLFDTSENYIGCLSESCALNQKTTIKKRKGFIRAINFDGSPAKNE